MNLLRRIVRPRSPVTPAVRSFMYATAGACLVLSTYGNTGLEQPFTSYPISSIFYALAAGGCFLGALQPQSAAWWLLSGAATVGAFGWRLMSVVVLTVQHEPGYDGHRLAASAGAYGFGLLAGWALWHWPLRPREGR